MKPSLLAAALCLAAIPASPAVTPALLNLAMPDAQALTGVQVDQIQSSPFGQYVLSQIQVDSELARIMTTTGFDPRKDLDELVAASASKGTGLVIGRGVFQPYLISTAAVMAGAVSSNYRGFEILTGARHPVLNGTASQSASFAFPDSSTVLLGDTASVKAAIDRYIAKTGFSGPLAQQAMQVSAGNDIWFVASQSPASFFAGKTPSQGLGNLANAFQAIQQTSGGVKFSSSGGATVALTLTADSAQDAQSLVDVGKFLVSMVDSNRNQNPAAGKAATLADAAVFSASGPVATVNLTLSEQQLEQLLMPPSGAQSKRRAAAH